MNIKFHGTENPNYHVRKFISAITLDGIDKNIFHIIFLWIFDKEVMKWYNIIYPRKVMNWNDLGKKFLRQYSYNADLLITPRDFELIKLEEKEGFPDFLAQWRENATHIADRTSKDDYVMLLSGTHSPHIGNIKVFENFKTLTNVGRPLEEESPHERTRNPPNSGEKVET